MRFDTTHALCKNKLFSTAKARQNHNINLSKYEYSKPSMRNANPAKIFRQPETSKTHFSEPTITSYNFSKRPRVDVSIIIVARAFFPSRLHIIFTALFFHQPEMLRERSVIFDCRNENKQRAGIKIADTTPFRGR